MDEDAATVTNSSAGSATSKSEESASGPDDRIKFDKRVSKDDIRLRAYQKWQAAGMPTGDGVRFWLEAERELARMPRFVSFDAGVVAALLGIGIIMAISYRNWIAAAFLFLGVLWMAWIPFRLRRAAKSNAPGER
jgi:Protein of unknown function (DUF2934)